MIQMIHKTHFLLIVAAAFLLFAAATLDAQVYRTQSGRALDVNMAARPQRPSRVNSGSYRSNTHDITSRISNNGVSSYHGGSGMYISLPSESINNFSRNTVGLSDVTSGVGYQAKPYYTSSMSSYLFGKPLSNSPTVTSSSQLYQAYQRPNTSMQQNQYESSASYIDYSAADNSYASTISPDTMINMTVKYTESDQGTFTYGYSTSGVTDVASGAVREQYSTLFGYMDSAGQEELNNQLMQNVYDRQIESSAYGIEGTSPQNDDTENTAEDTEADSEAKPNDMFVSLLLNIRQIDIEGDKYESLTHSPEARDDAYTISTVQVKAMKLSRLGGAGADRFNRLMRTGDRLMEKGEYYRAANSYNMAAMIGRNNPLSPLGAALGYLAAGETHRASGYLLKVLAMYPDIARVSVDINSMIGADLAQMRIRQLQASIDQMDEKDAQTLALMAFLKLNTAQARSARQLADILKELPDSPKEVIAFANRISPSENTNLQAR